MFAMAVSLIALPTANAQALIMNVGGRVLPHMTVDIDLNGGPGPFQNISLFVKYPGRADFTYIDSYLTRSNGDLDVYDFDFNETGIFQLKWALPPDFTDESNVGFVEVVTEFPPRKSFAYIGALPNPAGVGQEVLLHVGIFQPLQNFVMGWEGLSVTITKPDGTTDTISNIRTDSTGGTGRVYVPDEAGIYTLQSHFPEQTTTNDNYGGGTPPGVRILASDSKKLTLTVQEEPIEYYPGSPLPTEYWTRPINAQHREWYTIAGSNYMDADYNEAPESPHVLWTKPLTIGGLVGGDIGVQSFEYGDAYQGKYSSRFIVAGILIYTHYNSIRPLVYTAVNLRTGEEMWQRTFLNNQTIDLAQLFYWDSFNYHGTFAYLWVNVGSTWSAFDVFTGEPRYVMENVPSGTTLRGEKGEIYRLVINRGANWMALWNASALGSMQGSWSPSGGFGGNLYAKIDAGESGGSRARRAWAWNVTIPDGLPGSVGGSKLGDKVVGYSLTSAGGTYRSEFIGLTDVNIWALSLKPGSEGQLLYNKTWNAPAEWAASDYSSRWYTQIDANIGLIWNKEELTHHAFSFETGEYLWKTEVPHNYLDLYSIGRTLYNGKMYSVGQAGQVHCWDLTDGKLLWIYNCTDPYSEFLWGNQWSADIEFISEGKIYMFHSEHSPVNPLFRGAPAICLDAETGEEVWRVDGLFRKTDWGGDPIMGDSVIAGYNSYDQLVYAIGKGPSAITVTASPEVSVHGSSVIVKGMVTDVSPGTKDSALTMRFPNGVPAVSDDSMGEWMKYVYAQFERPAATGVDVILTVVDPNNNVYDIGTATSDSSGMFSYLFTPEVPGKYTVIATFAGSKSYYASFAETAIGVDEAPLPPPPEEPLTLPPTDMYIAVATVAIIIAIAIAALLLLRKR
jgi:hypothetical protein